MPKRPKIEPIRNPTLFEMEKLEQASDLVAKPEVNRPYPKSQDSCSEHPHSPQTAGPSVSTQRKLLPTKV
jgi:hypothetical protein